MMSTHITTEPLDLDALLRETADPSCGALCVFGGTVRDLNDGRDVGSMAYEAHATMAAKVLAELEAEVLTRWDDVRRCRIQHRIGHLELTEASVYVVVRSGHRAASFEAGKWAIDELKKRVPIWKEEHYTDGSSEFLDGETLKQ